MKPYIIPIVLALVALVFGGVYLSKEAKVPEEVTIVPDDRNSVVAEQAEEIAALKAKLAEAELVAQTKAATPVSPENGVASTASSAENPEVDGEPAPLTEQQKMEKMITGIIGNFMSASTNEAAIARREEMRTMREQQRLIEGKRRAAEQYGDLLSKFDLTLEERKEFLDILAKKSGGRWGGNQANQEEVEAEIQAFLGEEGYAEYREFEDTKYGRGKVKEFDKILGAGLALKPEQNEKMVDLFGGMEEFESDFRRDAGWGRWNRDSDAVEVDMDARLTELETEYNNIITESADVLDDRQLEALSDHLDTNLQRAEQGVNQANAWQKNMEQMIPTESREELRKMFQGGNFGRPQGR